jgi:hypothetical protein
MAYQAVWNETGTRDYEVGLRHGMLYQFDTTTKTYTNGVPFQGLTGFTATPAGAEPTDTYADDMKWNTTRGAETFGGTIEAVGIPPKEFDQNDGRANIKGMVIGQQTRKPFGFCYSTTIGDDAVGATKGEMLNLVYGASVSPSEKVSATMGETVELNTRSWEFTTVPLDIGVIAGVEYKPTAVTTVSSTDPDVSPAAFAELKTILYGDSATPDVPPSLPTHAELYALLDGAGTGGGTTTP